MPGVRIGDITFGMSKDDVLKELGEPDAIQLGEDEVVHLGAEIHRFTPWIVLCSLLRYIDIMITISTGPF